MRNTALAVSAFDPTTQNSINTQRILHGKIKGSVLFMYISHIALLATPD